MDPAVLGLCPLEGKHPLLQQGLPLHPPTSVYLEKADQHAYRRSPDLPHITYLVLGLSKLGGLFGIGSKKRAVELRLAGRLANLVKGGCEFSILVVYVIQVGVEGKLAQYSGAPLPPNSGWTSELPNRGDWQRVWRGPKDSHSQAWDATAQRELQKGPKCF